MPHDILDEYDRMELGAYALTDRRPFAPPGTKPKWTRTRPFDVTHVKLDLTFKRLEDRTFNGLCATSIKAVKDGAQHLTFDAVKLKIESVQDSRGNNLVFDYDDAKLTVTLLKPVPRGLDETIVVRYTCTNPPLGLYWILPNKDYPHERTEVWSQGQDEDNRHWFPCIDEPIEKATSELIVTVPQGFETLSNGKLVARKDDKTTTTFHWLQEIPHSIYLVTLVIGKYTILREDCDGIPLEYYVPPGREEDGKRSFSKTAKMLRFFVNKLGVPYPYVKYAQIIVTNFTWGGMENTSATTLTDLTLHDVRAHLDFRSEPLVAHELSHMWIGDLVTCKTWSQAWLHEGSASYLDPCFVESEEGRDEFAYRMLEEAEQYMQEDATLYRRPIVTNLYDLPTHLFDAHLYPGGAWRLHMLRHVVGDAAWWRVLHHFLTQHAKGVVETVDLQRSVEAVTGDPMDSFFNQWIYKAGYPEFKVSQSWEAEDRTLKVTVTQTQKEDDVTPAVFEVPADFVVTTEKGNATFKLQVNQREQTFYLPVAEKPLMVEFDPGCWVLMKLDFDRPETMLVHQLKHAKEAMSRIEAAKTLATKGTPTAIEALKETVLRDPFWGVQAQAAKALGTVPGELALQALVACTKVKHPKARRAVAAALGNYKDERAAEALLPLSKKDDSYFVEAEAATSLGKTKSPKAFAALEAALAKDSFREVIRLGVLAGLAELDDDRGIPLAIRWSTYGKPYPVRVGALSALGRLGKYREQRKDILDAIVTVFKEPFDALSWRPYVAAIAALSTRGHPDAMPYLQQVATSDPRPSFRRRAERAIQAISVGKDRGEELKKLRDDVEKMDRENVKLRDRLTKLEATLKPQASIKPKKQAKAAKPRKS
jgi:aminopeptidase N